MADWYCPTDDVQLVSKREMFGYYWQCPRCRKEFTQDLALSRTQGERAVKK